MANNDLLVWIDCEMTGLDLDIDELVEIAVIVTDSQLTPLHPGFQLVIKPHQSAMDNMGDFVRELLRWRPPASHVPHVALETFPMPNNFVIPKGAIVFPSLLHASSFDAHQDALRPSSEFHIDRDPASYSEAFLTFGSGPHTCPGKHYAQQHIGVFISLLLAVKISMSTADFAR